MTYYKHVNFEEQASEAIDADVNLPLITMVAFKIGKTDTQTETPVWTSEPDNKIGNTSATGIRFYSNMAEIYNRYLADVFGDTLEIEGKFPTGLTDLPGSDPAVIAQMFNPSAEGNVNNPHHGVEPSAIDYNLDFVLTEDLADESTLLDILRAPGEIDAKGWLAYWGYDGYLYGAGAVHPRMHRNRISEAIDNRTYLEKALEDDFELEASFDINDNIDQEILKLFGEVRDSP